MATEQKNTRNLFSTIKDVMKETEKTATPNFEDLKRRMEERKGKVEDAVSTDNHAEVGANLENYYITSETFCGLYNESNMQSFEDCVKEVQGDLTDDLLSGKSVYICREGEGPIAKCSITQDNKLEVQYAEKAEVDRFDFDKETTEYIENAKMNLMNEKDVVSVSTPNINTDDLAL